MKTHHMYGTREYIAWRNMKGRCLNPNDNRYHRYGGRGIRVCDRWLSFENFYADMGPSNGLTLERINVDGNYEPENCCWIPMREQGVNTSKTRFLNFAGKTQSVAQWARELGVKPQTISMRLNQYGWSVEKTLTKGKTK